MLGRQQRRRIHRLRCGRRVARLERFAQHVDGGDALELEQAKRFARAAVGMQVPAGLPVDELRGLHRAPGAPGTRHVLEAHATPLAHGVRQTAELLLRDAVEEPR